MLKSYILVFNGEQIDRAALLAFIDGIDDIVNWSAFLPNAVIITSSKSVKDLATYINERRSQKFQYLLIEPAGRNGWLPKDSWTFMNEPKPSSAN